jgi:S1-C subfamily serine protease
MTIGAVVLAGCGDDGDDDAGESTTTTTEATTTTVATAAVAPVVTPDEPTPQVIENTIVNEIGSAVNPSAVAVKTLPSIVTVSTFDSTENGFGSGSGVVLTEDGYIATNEHVVAGAASWQVTFEDGRVYEAELVGADPLTDLAVLKIDADDLVPIDIGSSDLLALGDPAVAVGNPLGQEGGSSVSVGIVSAFDRRVDFGDGSSLVGMIQTDAAINSGSSGGALVNAEGELIGITSAIGVSNAGPEGIGYAIPVEVVERITAEIIETGDVEHPFLGVTIGNYRETLADGGVVPAGAIIDSIEGTGSAAGAAGLQEGDVIVKIGGEPIESQNDLILAVRLYRVGDTVEFVALRDGDPVTVSVVMGQRPAEFGG